MLGPKETAPLAVIWAEQLDRFKISPKLYDRLLNDCVDFRRKALLGGKDFIPGFSVELFLAMFDKYKTATNWNIQSAWSRSDTASREYGWLRDCRTDEDKAMAVQRNNADYSGEQEVETFEELLERADARVTAAETKLAQLRAESFLFEGE